MTARQYATPAAFRTALEHRLKTSARDGADLNRRRQLVVFDRFLARVNQVMGEAVVLKGGLVLELRLDRARTTIDIDLRISGSSDEILERLQAAGCLSMPDFMRFTVERDKRLPELTGDGIIYEGEMARRDELVWPEIDALTRAVRQFLNPVLSNVSTKTWDHAEWKWTG